MPPPEIAYDNAMPAVQAPIAGGGSRTQAPAASRPVEAGRQGRQARPAADPTVRVNQANAAARVQPVRDGFINSMQVYPFVEARSIRSMPRRGRSPTSRFSRASSSSAPARSPPATPCAGSSAIPRAARAARADPYPREATRPELMTNLVINTDRRTYHMELRSTPSTYMASVSWQYPQDQLIALRRRTARPRPSSRSPTASISLASTSATRVGRPCAVATVARVRRRRRFIEFPRGIGQGEMPLFVVGPRARPPNW
jgi:type IV secretion system protein VirB9